MSQRSELITQVFITLQNDNPILFCSLLFIISFTLLSFIFKSVKQD